MEVERNKVEFEHIKVAVGGVPTKFSIGDHLRFNDGDVRRCVTKISIDSDGCVSYLLTSINSESEITSQWFTENDFRVMESLSETKNIGFG